MNNKDTIFKTHLNLIFNISILYKRLFNKKFLFLFFLLSSVMLINYGCQSTDSSDSYSESLLNGFVYDADSRLGIDSVNLAMDLNAYVTYTSDSGYYKFKHIQMPRDQYNVVITAARSGYVTRYINVSLHNGDSIVVYFYMNRN